MADSVSRQLDCQYPLKRMCVTTYIVKEARGLAEKASATVLLGVLAVLARSGASVRVAVLYKLG